MSGPNRWNSSMKRSISSNPAKRAASVASSSWDEEAGLSFICDGNARSDRRLCSGCELLREEPTPGFGRGRRGLVVFVFINLDGFQWLLVVTRPAWLNARGLTEASEPAFACSMRLCSRVMSKVAWPGCISRNRATTWSRQPRSISGASRFGRGSFLDVSPIFIRLHLPLGGPPGSA